MLLIMTSFGPGETVELSSAGKVISMLLIIDHDLFRAW